MGLVYCPECGTRVSDKAASCPFCGYRSSLENLPMESSPVPIANIPWDEDSLAEGFGQIFPMNDIQKKNLNVMFGNADNLAKVAPSLFQALKAMLPQKVLVAKTTKEIQSLLNNGTLKFMVDKAGQILPSIRGKEGIVAQIRLDELTLTPDLGAALIDLQVQLSMAQIVRNIYLIQQDIAHVHQSIQDDRLALAQSVWMQLQQASKMGDGRLREQKLLLISSKATDAKSTLFKAFEKQKYFFDSREDHSWLKAFFDKEAHEHGDERSRELFNSLLAITIAIQVETTAYCLLGETNAARACLLQFSNFIESNELSDRDTLLKIDSYSESSQAKLINHFTTIRENIATLPAHTDDTQPLPHLLSPVEENIHA